MTAHRRKEPRQRYRSPKRPFRQRKRARWRQSEPSPQRLPSSSVVMAAGPTKSSRGGALPSRSSSSRTARARSAAWIGCTRQVPPPSRGGHGNAASAANSAVLCPPWPMTSEGRTTVQPGRPFCWASFRQRSSAAAFVRWNGVSAPSPAPSAEIWISFGTLSAAQASNSAAGPATCTCSKLSAPCPRKIPAALTTASTALRRARQSLALSFAKSQARRGIGKKPL